MKNLLDIKVIYCQIDTIGAIHPKVLSAQPSGRLPVLKEAKSGIFANLRSGSPAIAAWILAAMLLEKLAEYELVAEPQCLCDMGNGHRRLV